MTTGECYKVTILVYLVIMQLQIQCKMESAGMNKELLLVRYFYKYWNTSSEKFHI